MSSSIQSNNKNPFCHGSLRIKDFCIEVSELNFNHEINNELEKSDRAMKNY